MNTQQYGEFVSEFSAVMIVVHMCNVMHRRRHRNRTTGLTFNCSCNDSTSLEALLRSARASSLSASTRDRIVETVRDGEGDRDLVT